MRTSMRHLMIAVSLACALPATSLAQTYWQVADGGWSTGGSWTAGEPVAGVNAFINNGGLARATSPGEICSNLYIGLAGGESGTLAVYNAGALQTQSYMDVGASGEGTVTHLAGPVTVGSTLNLGTSASGNGAYNLSGTGQLSADYIAVGSQGTGGLSIASGADASCLSGYVGRWSGSTGTVTVDGAGSTWTATSAIYVSGREAGAGGTGTLTIDNGGEVDAGALLKAWRGEVNVTSGTLRAAAMEIVGGADLNTGAGSTLDIPTATLSGSGTDWTHSSSLMVETGKVGSVTLNENTYMTTSGARIASGVGTSGSVTLNGLYTVWNAGQDLHVGRYGNGTLTIAADEPDDFYADGPLVTCGYAYIGRYSGSVGTVTVGEAGSFHEGASWGIGSTLSIGAAGTGTVEVLDHGELWVGGKVTVGATGTLALDSGSMWADEIELLPGATFDAGGGLYVNKLTGFGDAINMPNMWVVAFGYAPGGSAASHSVGAGQTFSCPDLIVGYNKAAQFRVENGGDVTLSRWCRIDENGALIVDGAGSTLVLGPSPVSFDVRQGSFHVTGGGQATINEHIDVGWVIGPSDVLVDGSGSRLTADSLAVGHNVGWGPGSVTVSNGGILEWDADKKLEVGQGGTLTAGTGSLQGGDIEVSWSGTMMTAGGTTMDVNSVAIDGAGSTWAHPSTLKIDTHTTGGPDSVAVSDGGAASCSYGWVGYYTGHTGSVTVDGLDSTWDVTNNMTVGYYGTGTLTITNEAIVSCASLDIGRKSTGNGTVTLGVPSHAELRITGDVNIGPEGTGLLDIKDLNGVEAGGKVTIHPGGTLNLEGGLYADELALLAGGTYQDLYSEALRINRLTGFGDSVNLDSAVDFGHSGGTGTHTVGLGQSFACNFLTVGYDSTAEFVVEHGGNASTAFGTVIIGDLSGADGTITVRHSGSRLDTGGELRVGDWGQGTLNVLDGGFVTAPGLLEIGHGGPGEATVDGGTITVTNGPVSVGEGSASGTLIVSNGSLIEWNAAQALSIGANGAVAVSNSELSGGSIQVAGGGSFSSDAASDLNVGSVTVDGSGTSWTHAGTLQIDTNLGVPSLSITGLGLVDVNGMLEIGTGGAVALNGGILQADTVNDPGTGTFTFTAGRLSAGTYQGSLHNQGGTVAPGLSPGTMTVTGDYTQDPGGALEIEITGTTPGQWDVLAVTGTANLDGALDVVLDGYSPAAGDSFEVVTWGSRSGAFATITGWENGGLAYLAIYGSNDLTLHCTWFGDATLDGCVDGLDYVAWSNNYMTGDTWQKGDFNGDLTADGLDYVMWSNNYWSGCPEAPGPVPEPAAGLLLILGTCALKRRRA